MKKPTILRKRYIPFETVDISGDELIHRDEEILVTQWKAIRPRLDFYGGISTTFLREGYKISKFYTFDMKFLYWYCDIIDVIYESKTDQYTLADLLVDIKVFPDGTYQVLDTDELADALQQGLVTQEQACKAMRKLNELLKRIYDGSFPPEACKTFEFGGNL